MKKRISLLVLVMVLLCVCYAHADEMGVQIIGENNVDIQHVNLDDIKIGTAIEVPDNCVFTPTSYTVVNEFLGYKKGKRTIQLNASYHEDYATIYNSGKEAEYALLKMDILNIQMGSCNFLEEIEVKVTNDDKYEFAGWAYQYNYDNLNHSSGNSGGWSVENANTECVVAREDEFPINPLYTGHYVFGCTLPNSVIEGKTPLRMEIKIAGNELTYHIRK